MPKHVPQGSEGFNPFGELIGLSFSKLDEGLIEEEASRLGKV